MKIFLLFVIIIIIAIMPFLTVLATENTDEKEDIYSQLCRAIIHLEHFEKVLNKDTNQFINKNIPDGTAFFVRSGNDLFVVTARHVVEKDYDLKARVQCKNRITGENEVILLTLNKNKWIFHPENQSEDTHYVDVAAMKIAWIRDRDIKYFGDELQNNEDGNLNQLPFEDPLPPVSILIFGFPLDVGFELTEQKPLGRLGIISMVTGERFLKLPNGKFAEPKTILIDSDIFRGNSGSPVIRQMLPLSPEIKLLGLVIATNEKLNYAVIEPVSRIRETIEVAKKEPRNIECWFPLN